MNIKVLVLAPIAPPIGGISQLGKFILENIPNTFIYNTKIPSILRKNPYSTTKSLFARDGFFLSLMQIIYVFLDFFYFSFRILKFDCIHIISSTGPGLYRNFIFFLLSKIFLKKCIFHLVGDIENHLRNKNKFHKLIISLNFSFINYIVVQSEKHESFFVKIGIRSKVIKNPSLLESSYLVNPYKFNNNSINILTVGIFGERKGFYRIISFAKSNYKYLVTNNIKFNFVGNGEEYNTLKKCIFESGLSNLISIYNNLPDKDIRIFYQNANLFLLPTSSDGMPLVIVDAISYGIPVISTNVGCISDVIVDDKLLINEISEWEKHLIGFLTLKKDKIVELSNKTFELYKFNYSQKVFLENISLIYGK
jgi:glycosyltransferase involved in cell wall biosynthesis